MTGRKALEQWELCDHTSGCMAYCEVSHKEGRNKGPLGLTYQPKERANTTADYLDNQFKPHDSYDEKS
jgi:hypothetical protein